MRPPGDIRKALRRAARELQAEQSAATWRDMAARASVGFKVARRTVDNMERAGELERVGAAKRAHSNRWMTLYAPTEPAPAPSSSPAPATPAIETVMRAWTR
jgi:hypothetical protein